MQKTKFAAINILRNDENGQHALIASGENGDALFIFELSREVATEIAKKLDVQILNTKNQKQWDSEEGPENAEAANVVALQ